VLVAPSEVLVNLGVTPPPCLRNEASSFFRQLLQGQALAHRTFVQHVAPRKDFLVEPGLAQGAAGRVAVGDVQQR
jgi:hypothetical protein